MFSKPVLLSLFKAKSLPFLPKSSQNRIACGNSKKNAHRMLTAASAVAPKVKVGEKRFQTEFEVICDIEESRNLPPALWSIDIRQERYPPKDPLTK